MTPDIETQQACCGRNPTEQQPTVCCGDNNTDQSSCCDGSTCGEATASGGQDSAAEKEQITTAAERTESLLSQLRTAWTPGWTETDVSEFLHTRMRQQGYDAAWEWEYCPVVHAGGDAAVGHSPPRERPLHAGEVLHIDFGVAANGFVADLQRVYYYPEHPDGSIPHDLQAAFDDVIDAITAGLAALHPGVEGHEIDAAARDQLTDRGWSPFNHAFGHQVGRDAHAGGTLLGPLWGRYGDRPRGQVKTGEVYSVEVGVGTTYGYVGIEEMIQVVEDGYEFIVEPQSDIRLLGTAN